MKSGRLPLRLRISIQYALFGLLIAYISFLLLTINGSRHMVHYYEEAIHTFLESGGDVSTLVQEVMEAEHDGAAVLPFLLDRNSFGHSLPDVHIFSKMDSGWQRMREGEALSLFKGRDEELIQALEYALEKGVHRDFGLFLGQEDQFSFYIDLSSRGASPSDPTVLRFTGSRQGITSLFRDVMAEFLLFSALILLISLALSQLFIRKILSPIKWLSEQALLVASGRRNRRLGLRGKDEIAKLSQSIDSMKDHLSEQVLKLERQADTLETMNRIDKAVLSTVSRRELLAQVTKIVSSLFPENAVFLLLRGRKNGAPDTLYRRRAGYGSDIDTLPELSAQTILSRLRDEMTREKLFSAEEIELCPQLRQAVPDSSRWIMNIPIEVEEHYYGSLLVSTDLDEPFSSDDRATLSKLTDQIGVALQSLLQVEAREELLLGSLMSLSAAIDAKSEWTAGHSQRVRDISLQIGETIGLEEQDIEQLSISALLHDIGKLAISEAILDKPGRLSDEEYAVVKTHPQRGADIIGHIPGSPQVLQGILHHHEHYAGGGYPDGLSGEAIPLMARIICIADVYDAISADRPYRKGMDRDQALEFMRGQRGKLFDPELLDHFLLLCREGCFLSST